MFVHGVLPDGALQVANDGGTHPKLCKLQQHDRYRQYTKVQQHSHVFCSKVQGQLKSRLQAADVQASPFTSAVRTLLLVTPNDQPLAIPSRNVAAAISRVLLVHVLSQMQEAPRHDSGTAPLALRVRREFQNADLISARGGNHASLTLSEFLTNVGRYPREFIGSILGYPFLLPGGLSWALWASGESFLGRWLLHRPCSGVVYLLRFG